jgi:hypothetical protein
MSIKKVIENYKLSQEDLGNDMNDKNRFKPDDEFYESLLEDCKNIRTFADVYEVNVKEKYVIIDLLDDIGLYKISIEKLA